MKLLSLFLVLLGSFTAQAQETASVQPLRHGSYYAWGLGQDNTGHCYEYASNGGVLNGGMPVANYLCGRTSHQWGLGQDNTGHCYEYGDRYVLNGGMPVANYLCGRTYYRWGTGNDGTTHCYEYGGPYVLNQGMPVANYLCGG